MHQPNGIVVKAENQIGAGLFMALLLHQFWLVSFSGEFQILPAPRHPSPQTGLFHYLEKLLYTKVTFYPYQVSKPLLGSIGTSPVEGEGNGIAKTSGIPLPEQTSQ